jgi:peptidoglycan/xylan/chitin deacetylase (PgdA/CDA1 family)
MDCAGDLAREGVPHLRVPARNADRKLRALQFSKDETHTVRFPDRTRSFLTRQVLPRVASAVPAQVLHAISGTRLIVPYWHMVNDEQIPHVKHLYTYRNVRQFQKDIDFFVTHYSPVTLKEVLQHLAGKCRLPRRCVLLTFDDGFREMYDTVAPILKAKGISAVFFLCSGFVDNADMAHHCKLSLLVDRLSRCANGTTENGVRRILEQNGLKGDRLELQVLSIRYSQKHVIPELAAACDYDFGDYLSSYKPYLTSEQVRRLLDQGFFIGAHSVDHPLYAELPFKEQIRQTVESMRFMVEHFELNYRAFAFPHSDAGVRVEFFNELRGKRQLQVSFGTAGMRRHFVPWNLERFSMENSSFPAVRIVRMNYLRGLHRQIFA